MTEQRKAELIIWRQDRPGVLRIQADRVVGDRDNLEFFEGAKMVAISTPGGVAANAGALVGIDATSFCPTRLGAVAEPLPLPVEACAGFVGWSAPVFWPLLSGLAIGFIGGFGLALSHLGLW